jgi:hypothetical protein
VRTRQVRLASSQPRREGGPLIPGRRLFMDWVSSLRAASTFWSEAFSCDAAEPTVRAYRRARLGSIVEGGTEVVEVVEVVDACGWAPLGADPPHELSISAPPRTPTTTTRPIGERPQPNPDMSIIPRRIPSSWLW